MNSATLFFVERWLALLCLLVAVGCLLAAARQRRRHGFWSWPLYLPPLVLATYGVGCFDFMPDWAGPAIAMTALGGFVVSLFFLILSGFWLPPIAYVLTALLFFGLGAWTGPASTAGLNDAFIFLTSLRAQEPWWLLLLLFIPVLIWTSSRNLLSLGPVRRWMAIGLRCSLIILLAGALAEVHARKPSDSVTVLFVWDRSLSIPPDVQEGIDAREKRTVDFLNNSVQWRDAKHAQDRVGLIVFGKQPKLELPPGRVEKLGFKKVLSEVDRTYTDIAAAIKLALASFPEGAGKRIVLISDGNENMGNAEEQARIAKQNGVQIDVVPIAAKREQQNEILVERIEAPPVTDKDTPVPIRVVIRSHHPQVVVAELHVRKLTFDPDKEFVSSKNDKEKNMRIVKLRQGLNVYYFPQAGAKDNSAFAYEAKVVPLRVETPEGKLVHNGLPGDRVDNNEARASVIARGERAVLIIEPEIGNHRLLMDRLQLVRKSLKIDATTPEKLRQLVKEDPETLATFLTKYDAVIFANIPADSMPEELQKVFRSNVHEQGAGFVMIGGNQSFGAGGWQNTEIEKALPVNMELKSMKIEGKSGLVLMMHASEMAEGNAWQRKIAKLAIEKLSPMDMVGQLHYDHGFGGGQPGHRWHIPFQEIGGNRGKILKLVESMDPGDMPDVDPAFEKAYKELMNPAYQLGTKHIIFISDGDHWDASFQVLQKIKKAKITCTTVCITTHGQDEVKKMAAVAQFTGGRSYHIKDPKELPSIYIKETRLVSKSFVHEKKFQPLLSGMRQGPTEGMQEPPPLYGFVRTTPKESNLVQVLIETPNLGDHKFPILAAWQYGLGKSIAFTSDARTLAKGSAFWDKDWANSEEGMYAKFWGQTMDWVMRPTETGKHLFLTTEHKDGKIRVIVEAQDLDKTPLTEVKLKAGISSPTFKVKDGRKQELKFEQKNAGVYEAEFSAEEVGAYFINIEAKWKKEVKVMKNGKEVTVLQEFGDSVRAGATIPYSPEFAEMESNPSLLEKLAEATGGKQYADDAKTLEDVARRGDLFRPVPQSHASMQPLWPWLVFLTALCLLLDVAIRRIALQPEIVWSKAVAMWQRLRGEKPIEEATPVFIERLKSRKVQVDKTMEKQKAGRKFETTQEAGAAAKPVETAGATPDAPKPKEPPKPAKKEEPEEDFATRLMRAKKKAMEERDKDKK